MYIIQFMLLNLPDLSRALRACGNPHRLRLLRLILQSASPLQQRTVVIQLRLPQFLAARYLQILTDSGLIQRTRRGIAVFYRKASSPHPHIRRLQRLVRSLPQELFG